MPLKFQEFHLSVPKKPIEYALKRMVKDKCMVYHIKNDIQYKNCPSLYKRSLMLLWQGEFPVSYMTVQLFSFILQAAEVGEYAISYGKVVVKDRYDLAGNTLQTLTLVSHETQVSLTSKLETLTYFSL